MYFMDKNDRDYDNGKACEKFILQRVYAFNFVMSR